MGARSDGQGDPPGAPDTLGCRAPRRECHEPSHWNRPGNHELLRGHPRGWSAGRDPQHGWLQDDAVDLRRHRRGQAPGGTPRQAPGRHEREEHGLRGQAADRAQLRLARGHQVQGAPALRAGAGPEQRRARARGRPRVHDPGDLGHRAARDEAGRRGVSRRHGAAGGHHRARLLQRRPAPDHSRRGPHRRPRAPAHHQRAHRRGARLRLRPRQDREHRGLRPGRRHLRHLDPADGQGRDRGARDLGRHAARRRGLRPQASSSTCSPCSRRRKASRCAATPWRCSA